MFLGDEAASFTKEEMQQGKHTDYEKQLHDDMLSRLDNTTPPIQPPEVEELPPPVSNGKYFDFRYFLSFFIDISFNKQIKNFGLFLILIITPLALH